jgi:hypothetical protein
MAKSDKKIVKLPKVEEVIPVNEEKSSSEHFLVIWEESGDETHFLLLPMNDFESVTKIVKKISERKISSKEIITLVDSIKTKSITDIFIQTYCTEDWPFGKYNIKKIINIPELGW